MTSGEASGPGADGLRESVADGWQRLRAAVERVGGEGLERPMPSGWTGKQMLAHIAAWHAITAARLRTNRDVGGFPSPPRDEDAVNAEVAAAASHRPPEAVLRDLDTSYEALQRELEELDDTAVRANDGWAEAIVAGNTFGHYAEHLGELVETG